MKKALIITSVSLITAGGLIYNSLTFASADQNKTKSIQKSSESLNEELNELSIKEMMLNSIRFYEDVKGKFKNITPHRNIEVEFEVKEGENPYSHIKVINKEKDKVVKESVSDEKEVITVYPEEKAYKKIELSPIKTEKLNQLTRSTKTKQNGKTVKTYKPDPATSLDAKIVIYPQEIAYWLDDNERNYKITGNEPFLNRRATVIEGDLLEDLADKFKAKKFKMWVDSETGVLLKLITTNNDGEETSIIEVQEIEFNKGIKNKLDTNDIKRNYKKI